MSMDNYPPCHQSLSEDANRLQNVQSSVSEKQTSGAAAGGLVNDIENTFNKALHIQDAEEPECTSDGDGINDILERNASEEPDIHQTKSEQKCLSNCATFPCHSEMSPAAADEEKEDLEAVSQKVILEKPKHSTYSCSISLPTPFNLVSAMKGSREKQGVSPNKLTVTWAPDVYDPQPSSLSHTVGKKQPKSRKNNDYKSKKNGKNKQKGNSARGSSGKDKKQFRKTGGGSNRCYKSLDACDKAVSSGCIDKEELENFDIGSPDPYCGSSFLKKSLSKMHYSVAEAL